MRRLLGSFGIALLFGGMALGQTNASSPVPVSDNPLALTKGTQGANGFSVQELKDAGRTSVILSLTKATAITTAALVTLTQKKGTATTTTGTSYTVASGKTLRIQSIFVGITNITTAAVDNVAVSLRMGAASGGAVSVTSDVMAEVEAGITLGTATLGNSGNASVNFPDGLEIPAGQNLGVSMLSLNIDAAVTVVIVGFEY